MLRHADSDSSCRPPIDPFYLYRSSYIDNSIPHSRFDLLLPRRRNDSSLPINDEHSYDVRSFDDDEVLSLDDGSLHDNAVGHTRESNGHFGPTSYHISQWENPGFRLCTDRRPPTLISSRTPIGYSGNSIMTPATVDRSGIRGHRIAIRCNRGLHHTFGTGHRRRALGISELDS